MSTVRDAVLLAAETLEEHPERWLQGDLYDADAEEGCYQAVCACALGMCQVAAFVLRVPSGMTWDTVQAAFTDTFGIDIATYNDGVATNPAEVAARLRELAERL